MNLNWKKKRKLAYLSRIEITPIGQHEIKLKLEVSIKHQAFN